MAARPSTPTSEKTLKLNNRKNVVTVLADFMLSGSDFQRVGAATEIFLDLIYVFNLGTKIRREFYDRSRVVS